MSNEITKEEINALMSVQSKAVEQQVMIAERLKIIADNQEKTLNRLQNGLARDIIERVNEENCGVKKEVIAMRQIVSAVKGDISWVKWLFSSIGIIVTITMVFINVYWMSQEQAIQKKVDHRILEILDEHDRDASREMT